MMRDDRNNLRKRQQAERRGKWAERFVSWHYRLRGYRLIARRFRCPQGEIDLIMQRGNTIVFIEVKSTTSKEDNLDRVLPTALQQGRIRATAHFFLGRFHQSWDVTRIDVVVYRPPLRIIRFEDVFRD